MRTVTMSTFNRLVLIAALLINTSCAQLVSVSMTQVPADRSHPIKAQSHDWVVLGFKFNNDFADKVRTDLQAQCPTGKVTGLYTKHETYLHLYLIIVPFWKRVVSSEGYCVAGT